MLNFVYYLFSFCRFKNYVQNLINKVLVWLKTLMKRVNDEKTILALLCLGAVQVGNAEIIKVNGKALRLLSKKIRMAHVTKHSIMQKQMPSLL